MSWVQSSPVEVTFCHWIFCFNVVQLLMPILALLPMPCVCEKLELLIQKFMCVVGLTMLVAVVNILLLQAYNIKSNINM